MLSGPAPGQYLPGQTGALAGLNRLGYQTELPNLYLVEASAGYPSVPGVISNGMNVVELMTGQSVRRSLAVV